MNDEYMNAYLESGVDHFIVSSLAADMFPSIKERIIRIVEVRKSPMGNSVYHGPNGEQLIAEDLVAAMPKEFLEAQA